VQPLLHDLRTGASRVPVGYDSLPGSLGYFESIELYAVGSWGVSGAVTGYRWAFALRLNWRTGAFALDNLEFLPPGVVEDLNKPGLLTRVCTPLRPRVKRTDIPLSHTTAYFPLAYDRPYGLTRAGRHGKRLELLRCGSHRVRLLARNCRGFCDHQLGGGVATWVETRRVRQGRHYSYRSRAFSHEIRRRRTTAWPVLTAALPATIRHTADNLFASTIGEKGLLGNDAYPYTVRVARLVAR
jgi:hypothetical protein